MTPAEAEKGNKKESEIRIKRYDLGFKKKDINEIRFKSKDLRFQKRFGLSDQPLQ